MAKPTILFLDDEERIVRSLRLLFLGRYEILIATEAHQALELIKEHQVDVIVSDQRMPGMTGVEFLAQARALSPASIRILLTGYSDLQAISDSINEGEIFRYIQKPWDNEKLLSTIDLAVEAAQERDAADAPSELNLCEEIHILIIDSGFGTFDKVQTLFESRSLSRCAPHHAKSLDQALQIFDSHPIGVVLSDVQFNGSDIIFLLKVLKANYPQVVTIVASEALDAEDAIDLINEGQIYRYLPRNTSIKLWELTLISAMKRHQELMRQPSLSKRYQVEQVTEKPIDLMQRKTITERLRGFGKSLFAKEE